MLEEGVPVPKVFDCFTLNDEVDLLELRLELYSDIVDHFVVVEATRTFNGEPKKLWFGDQKERFRRWEHQLRHVVVEDLPDPVPSRWVPEEYQRDQILRGIGDAEADDVVLVADVDEFPLPAVMRVLRAGVTGLTALEMEVSFARANWLVPGYTIRATRAMPAAQLERPHFQRNHVYPAATIPRAGVHLTYLNPVEGLVRKFSIYGHAEHEDPVFSSSGHIQRCQRLGVDLQKGRRVVVRPAGELNDVQLALLDRRPELFDFRPPGAGYERWLYECYGYWRRYVAADGDEVLRADQEYEMWRSSALQRAALGAAHHYGYQAPRNLLVRARQALLGPQPDSLRRVIGR